MYYQNPFPKVSMQITSDLLHFFPQQIQNMVNIRRFIIIGAIICTIYIFYRANSIDSVKIDYNFRISSLNKNLTNTWLIVTSITQLQHYLLSSQPNISIIFIGDRSNLIKTSNTTNIIFLDSQLQSQLPFRSRNTKSLAYLLAITHGARFIYEYNSFHHHQHIQHVAFRRQRSPFINIYPTFTGNFTDYSPCLPKDHLTNISQDGWSSIRKVDSYQETICPLIQQQIQVYYQNQSSLLIVNHPPVAIEPLTFAPFSNENILFTYDAFWGLILLKSKSDIWRSWWVQRLLWDIDGHVVFASSPVQNMNGTTTTTENNNDNRLKEDKNIGEFVQYLTKWKSTKSTLIERIEQLIQDIIQEKFCDPKELKVIQDWLYDLRKINYIFPFIKPSTSQQSSSKRVRRRRTAVCMTGLIECIDEAAKPTLHQIRTHVQGEMDVFMYLSSTEPVVDQLSTVSLRRRIIEALHYTNFTVKVLFENIPKLAPHFPPNCTTDASVDQPGHKIPRYYQQLFGLSNCFSLVRDYEKKHNIKYDLMVRTRADIEFLKIPSTFDRTSPNDINTTLILPPNRYGSRLDDGFAIGPIDSVEVYMNRYYSFEKCLTHDLHPERYLYFYLNHQKVKMTVDGNTVVGHIPHSPNRCH